MKVWAGFLAGVLFVITFDVVHALAKSGFQTDAFVKWAEDVSKWHQGDIKIDLRFGYEAKYLGTKILPDRVYAVYIERIGK